MASLSVPPSLDARLIGAASFVFEVPSSPFGPALTAQMTTIATIAASETIRLAVHPVFSLAGFPGSPGSGCPGGFTGLRGGGCPGGFTGSPEDGCLMALRKADAKSLPLANRCPGSFAIACSTHLTTAPDIPGTLLLRGSGCSSLWLLMIEYREPENGTSPVRS